jgi:hypothetical protein
VKIEVNGVHLGSPPAWAPSLDVKYLNPDSSQYYQDVNSALYPQYAAISRWCNTRTLIFYSYPAEPTFRALLTMHPDIDVSVFDVIGCSSTFGNLLRFCEGIKADFRFNVDRVGDNLFLTRKESSPHALIRDMRGYGHTFPETHTSWDPRTKGSICHQRIVQYDFGGLTFLVRSVSDGYLKQEAGPDGNAAHPSKSDPRLDDNGNGSENIPSLEKLRISGEPEPYIGPLRIQMGGRQIPQHAIFDLKTRAKDSYRPIDKNEVHRRLWLNQTPYFIYAEHSKGFFEPCNIHPESVLDAISKWEKDHETLLNHYQAIVKELIAVTKASNTGKLQVIRRGRGPLKIWERLNGDNSHVLPGDLRSRWG